MHDEKTVNAEPDEAALLSLFARLAVEAGAAILALYGKAAVRRKPDHSPVSEADEAAEAVILAGLAREAPQFPVVAEEQAAAGRIPEVGASFILVDPLDGTREFISGNGEFTVNIALIVDGAPRVGAVFAPALGDVWLGSAGLGARHGRLAPGAPAPAFGALAPIHARRPPERGWTAFASRSHNDPETESLLAGFPVAVRLSAGSSLKFCRLAEGLGDIYPRCGPTMEWDTAAGDAILRAAGGHLTDRQGRPFVYGKAGFRNGAFVAWGAQPPRPC